MFALAVKGLDNATVLVSIPFVVERERGECRREREGRGEEERVLSKRTQPLRLSQLIEVCNTRNIRSF